MAIVTTTKSRVLNLVWSGDQSVTVEPSHLSRRQTVARDKRIRAALAELPADTTAADIAATADKLRESLPVSQPLLAWVPMAECTASGGATVAAIRGLSWLEDQEAQSLPAAEQIKRTIELGLVSIDGDAELAKAFKADAVASLWTPLYHAIAELTWGN